MDDDSQLLRLYAQEGSEEAFAELVRRRIALVYGSAYRQLGDARKAEDVAQSVFTDLARKASQVCSRPMIVSWLYTSTHHAVTNLIRGETRQRLRDMEALHMQETDAGTATTVDWDVLRPLLDGELNNLDPRDRDAVLMRYFEGRSFAGIAAVLKLSEEACRKRVDRALDRLRQRLKSRGVASTAAMLSGILTEQSAVAAPAGLAASVTQAALVSTAASAAAVGTLGLMTTSKTALAVGAALALLSLGTATYEGLQVRSSNRQLAALESENISVASQLAKVEAATAAADRADVLAAQAHAAKAKAAAAASASTAVGGNGASSLSKARAFGDAFMERHPEVKSALMDYIDAGNRARYGPLFASLGLTSEQIQKLLPLLRFGYNFGRYLNQGMVSLSATEDPSPETAMANRAAIQDFLGDAGFQQLKAYWPTIPARSTTTDLAGLLATTGTPLTSDQAQQLVAAFSAPGIADNHGGFNWEAVYPSVQGLLSRPQMEMLRNLGTHSQGWQQVTSAIH